MWQHVSVLHGSLLLNNQSFFFLIGVQLLYNVVLVSAVLRSESAICIHISPFFFGFPSHLGHHRALSRVLCAIQQVLIRYLFYTQYQQCICVNPHLPIPPTPVSPLVSIYLFSMSVSLFLLCKQNHLYHFSRFHIYVLIYDICFSLSDLLHSV